MISSPTGAGAHYMAQGSNKNNSKFVKVYQRSGTDRHSAPREKKQPKRLLKEQDFNGEIYIPDSYAS